MFEWDKLLNILQNLSFSREALFYYELMGV
jgi:hypothetical protein